MKLCLLISIAFFSFNVLFAQNNFKKTVPPFEISLTNGKGFTSKDLKANQQLMLVYFSPTCEHCEAFTTDLLKNIEQLKDVDIIMVSYQPIEEVKKFESDFKLSQYPNIKVGTEGYSFIVQKWYNIQRFPFVALFDKEDTLIAAYRNVPAINILTEKIKTSNKN